MAERGGRYPRIRGFAAVATLSALALAGCADSRPSQPPDVATTSASSAPNTNASPEPYVSPAPLYTPPSPSVDPITEQFLEGIKDSPLNQRLSAIITQACMLRGEDLRQWERYGSTEYDTQILSLEAVYDAAYGVANHTENQIRDSGEWPDAATPAEEAQCPDNFLPLPAG